MAEKEPDTTRAHGNSNEVGSTLRATDERRIRTQLPLRYGWSTSTILVTGRAQTSKSDIIGVVPRFSEAHDIYMSMMLQLEHIVDFVSEHTLRKLNVSRPVGAIGGDVVRTSISVAG